MRLDLYLVKYLDFPSRHQAQIEIKHGRVKVNGDHVLKPSFSVTDSATVELLEPFNPYVSKGGLKLEKALNVFNINVKNMHVLDIGASTGGFTDCLLKHHAKSVITVDVGKHQLVDNIRQDPRVEVYESLNFLNTDATFFKDVHLLVMDVSFTSSLPLIVHAKTFLDTPMIVLIKPQFESLKTPKTGVIKNKKMHIEILTNYLKKVQSIGLNIDQITYSPIKGGSGNIEFLAYIKSSINDIDVTRVVEEAHTLL